MAKDAQPVDVHIFTVNYGLNYGGRQGVSFKFHFPIFTQWQSYFVAGDRGIKFLTKRRPALKQRNKLAIGNKRTDRKLKLKNGRSSDKAQIHLNYAPC